MRRLAVILLLLTGSAVTVGACAEAPPGSGCFYEVIGGKLVAEAEEGTCPLEVPFWWGGGSGGTTTTQLAPTPPAPGPEPVVSSSSLPPAASPTAETTTTSGATAPSMAPVQFTAMAACRVGSLGVVLSGTATPGSLVTISSATPYQWYYQQPSPPTAAAADGTWRFEMGAEVTTWFPFAATLASSLGGTVDVALAAC